jgi:hypothetical protein
MRNAFLLLLCAVVPFISVAQDCKPLPKTGCNYIRNHTFLFYPPTNCAEAFDAFQENTVPSWRPASGSPDVNPAWTTVTPPSSPASNFAYMFTRQKQMLLYGVIPYIYDREVESIMQQVPVLRKGERYSLSYFLQRADVLPAGVTQTSNLFGCGYGASSSWKNGNSVDQFNIVLMHCSDAPAAPVWGDMLPIPANSQKIVCQYDISNNSWLQFHSEFIPEDDYDMILVYPEPTKYHVPEDPNMITGGGYYTTAIAFAHPEIIAVNDMGIQLEGVNAEKCEVTLGIHCNITNADVKWYDPSGNGLGNGTTIVVDGHVTGTYKAEVYSPGASSNNGCSNNNPAYSFSYDLQPPATAKLQFLNATVEYDYHPDGTNTFSNGSDIMQLVTKDCGYNYNELCKFTDEGKLVFNLSSSEASGNEWEIYRDGQLVSPVPSSYNPAITLYSSTTGNYSQQFDPAVDYIGFNVPTIFEIRLKNSVLNEQQSVFLKLKPQASLSMGACHVDNGSWISTQLSSYYTNSSTQYLWEQLPPGLVYTLAPNHMDLSYDPSSISGSHVVIVKTSGSDYGCERMRYITISPNLYECGMAGRAVPAQAALAVPESKKLSVYPNPARSFITLNSSKPVKEAVLYSADGNRVKQFSIIQSNQALNVSDCRAGCYMLMVQYKDGTKETRVIVKL